MKIQVHSSIRRCLGYGDNPEYPIETHPTDHFVTYGAWSSKEHSLAYKLEVSGPHRVVSWETTVVYITAQNLLHILFLKAKHSSPHHISSTKHTHFDTFNNYHHHATQERSRPGSCLLCYGSNQRDQLSLVSSLLGPISSQFPSQLRCLLC